VELRHRIGHPFLRTPTDREHVHPLGRRLLAWALRWRLDEALAAGADPEADPLIACRADHLVSAAARHRLADGLRGAVEGAVLPRPTSTAAPLASASVRANSGLLLVLVRRLDSDDPIDPRGAAKARQLLSDSGSPLYEPASPLRLEDEVESTLIALGPQEDRPELRAA
jgi:hypothetical protein